MSDYTGVNNSIISTYICRLQYIYKLTLLTSLGVQMKALVEVLKMSPKKYFCFEYSSCKKKT